MTNPISKTYYKAFDSSLSCRDFQYKIDHTFRIEGDIIICEKGFHCCEDIKNCLKYYPEDSRFCEVRIGKNSITKDDKTVTSEITIVRELTKQEIRRLDIERHFKDCKLHSEGNKLDVVYTNGDKRWYKEGKLHREGDKPAIERTNGTKGWYKEGNLHREGDKPAAIYANGDKEWWKEGKLHREGDKPAVVYTNGTMEWYKYGLPHREGDNTAIINADGRKVWYKGVSL